MIDVPLPLVRPGLPLDPLLQLQRGELVLVGIVAWTGGLRDPVSPANPMRVALYIAPLLSVPTYQIVPAPGPAAVPFQIAEQNFPVYMHVRDYPGLVQSAWVGAGAVGTSVTVWEYTLIH